MRLDLEHTLARMADNYGLDAQQLIAYAAEDTVGGWTYLGYWPGGSIWEVEGKILYALMRAIRPDQVLECGTRFGCSSTHILTAMKANKRGKLTSVDAESAKDEIGDDGFGSLVPASLRKRWTFIRPMTAQALLDSDPTPWQVVFEDTDHTFDTTREILERLKGRPGVQYVISHDIAHPWVGPTMRQAWTAVFGEQDKDWHAYDIEPSDCGFAVWRRT